ncbi:hypothetical protein [Ideonella sp. A 288]|uniref:hypothetical protein n=1 Tax=Ideonella sp. A 288 TaxID=1962181 RepID=UPI000B4C0CBA|nr:hypothetical protein [Ideonella sp. A 288]
MPLARLTFARPGTKPAPRGITLVVYAPYGSDADLSGYPDSAIRPLDRHPLLRHLAAVAACGVHVCALVDLIDDSTWLVEFEAHAARPTITSRWKQQMDAAEPLRGLIRHACEKHPGTALVLGLEGHGAGYLPEIDRRVLTAAQLTDNGSFEWHLGSEGGAPVLPTGSPLLPTGSPLLPTGSPLLPTSHLPMSTWALGQAIASGMKGQSNRLGVIYFNSCFNLSVEVLHTVSPLAEFAAGYANYNFFTAGEAYARAFAELKAHRHSATTRQLATWLVEANGRILQEKSHHPTVGGVVALDRMAPIARGVDALAKAMIDALTAGGPDQHREVAEKIRSAIRRAQQYDTHTPVRLEAPDELTDLGSLAHELTGFDVNPTAVQAAARQLRELLDGIKVYGEAGVPWIAPGVHWDFSRRELSMNILCPDPNLTGLWDWRSPFYLQPDADRLKPAVQPHVIDFLKQTAWVQFIIEYHRHRPFKGLRPALIPACVRFNRAHAMP